MFVTRGLLKVNHKKPKDIYGRFCLYVYPFKWSANTWVSRNVYYMEKPLTRLQHSSPELLHVRTLMYSWYGCITTTCIRLNRINSYPKHPCLAWIQNMIPLPFQKFSKMYFHLPPPPSACRLSINILWAATVHGLKCLKK